jgi:type IV pilus assembly protein PilA
MSTFCAACGNSMSADDQFCRVCGRQVSAPGSVPVVAAPMTPAGPPETSGKAIVSLISGLFIFFFPFSVVAIIFGHLSLSEIGKSAGRLTGRGMAIAGLVLGYAGVSFIPILIIAAIAIPNLLRARMAANESSAVASVRTLNTAESAYALSHTEAGYTCSLSDLSGAGLIDTRLASGLRSGYMFELAGCGSETGTGANTKYLVRARPVSWNQTGVRAFCSDESAVIRQDRRGSAARCSETGIPLE